MANKNVFISYRRADTKSQTHSLYKDLIGEFSEQQIFMDVDDILPGTDFVQEINKKLNDTHAMIVMIGSQWAGLENEEGQRRLFEPRDFVRLEIEQALKKKIKVFPVLVDNAIMPSEQELPESIKSLSRLHALSLSSKDFNYQQHQVQQIFNTLAIVLDPTNTRHFVAPKAKKKTFGQKFVRAFMWIGLISTGLLGVSMWALNSNLGNTIDAVSQPQPFATQPSPRSLPTRAASTNNPNAQPSITSNQNQINAELAKNGVNIGSDGSISINTSININGTWHDEFGGQYIFRQSGTVFNMDILTNNNRSQTTGLIAGEVVYFGNALGTLEADKQHMQVKMNDGTQFRLHKGHLPQ